MDWIIWQIGRKKSIGRKRWQTAADMATIFLFEYVDVYCCLGNTVFGSNIHSSQPFSSTF